MCKWVVGDTEDCTLPHWHNVEFKLIELVSSVLVTIFHKKQSPHCQIKVCTFCSIQYITAWCTRTGDNNVSLSFNDSLALVVHLTTKCVWFNYLAVLHGLYWTQGETLQHVTLPSGNVTLSSLCELRVIMHSSVIFLSCLCMCVCVFSVRVPASCFPEGDPLGWQSCPVVITLPGAASGTIWLPPLEPHQSRHAGGKPKRLGRFKNSQSWHNKTPQSTETGSSSW